MFLRTASPILWLLGLSMAVSAQDASFIQPLPALDLTPQQSANLAAIRDLPTSQDVKPVRVNTNLLRAGDELPATFSPQASALIKYSSRDVRGDSLFSWTGTVPTTVGGSTTEGSTTIAVNGANVTASIQAADGLYRIQPIGNGLHALVKVDVSKFPSEHPPSFDQNNPNLRDIPPFTRKSETDTSITSISVVVAYTPAVQKKVADVAGLVQLAFIEANQSYKNSGIYINLVPATTPALVNYTETGSMDTDLAAFNNMAMICQLRANNNANIALLLADDSEACGLARQIFATGDSAFALVYYNCATGLYSFAHEIGHLQGARHNPEADNSTSPFPYGHGFMDLARKRRTIMSYDCSSGCDRQNEWARPTEWGNFAISYDAKVLNETALYVSQLH